jgi:hypothetical protein
MSTLTALKLAQELQLTRRAAAATADRPKLLLTWSIDSETGRPVARWVAVSDTAVPAVTQEPVFT